MIGFERAGVQEGKEYLLHRWGTFCYSVSSLRVKPQYTLDLAGITRLRTGTALEFC